MVGQEKSSMAKTAKRTSIEIKEKTKERLDRNKNPGQAYDGFINQLMDLWEKIKANKK